MDKLKPGDVITVKTESVMKDYGRNRDFKALKIESDTKLKGFASMKALSEESIYQVVQSDIHPDFVKYGIKVNHYTLRGQKIESIAFVKEGEVLINGEYSIPFDTAKITNLSETFFFDEVEAQVIATELNKVEREHLKNIKEIVANGEVMLDQIIQGARV